MKDFIASELNKIKEDQLWRSLSSVSQWNEIEIVLEGKRYLNFSTNDYLGLSQDPKVIEAYLGSAVAS